MASPSSGYSPLNVQFGNQSVGVDASDSFFWSVNNSVFSTNYNSRYIYTWQGKSDTTLIVIDNLTGCANTTTLTLVVDGEITYAIPNVFTPNGDGNNDFFSITSS